MLRFAVPAASLLVAAVCVVNVPAQVPDSRPASAPASAPAAFLDSGSNAWVDRTYDLEHLDIELWFDFERRHIRGTATQTLRPLNERIREITFLSRELKINRILVNNAEAAFKSTENAISVDLGASAGKTAPITVAIEYEGNPVNGLHWGAPEKGYEWKWLQCYSQGQTENNQYWIPMHDYPNDRATWSTTLHVPTGLTAVSNGAFLGATDDPGGATRAYRYKLEQPNCTYLISVAIGPWEKYTDDWRGIPVEYYVGPGVGEARARRSFGATPRMLTFFSDWIGTAYPYAKYSQTAVYEFVTGGMENVSATTQSDNTLHDERAHLERDSDGLVAHELAHMWWGDMLTCNGWRHLWLNEGFATYFTALWIEHDRGLDAYKLYMDGQRRSFLGADSPESPRALVTTPWTRRGDAANAHVYTKGSSVLHMLRFVIGDELFRKAISVYAKKYQYQLVETRDLERVVADVTGEGLEWFWHEWAYMQGAPALEIKTGYDTERGIAFLTLRQTQKTSPTIPLFKMPVDIAVGFADGRVDVHRVWFDKAEHRYEFSMDKEPAFIRFDEGSWIAARIKHDRPIGALLAQSTLDKDVVGRLEALQQLNTVLSKEKGIPSDATALITKTCATVLASNDAKEVRAAAAVVLRNIKNEAAAQLLLASLKDSQASVRRAAADSLSAFDDVMEDAIVETLTTQIAQDPAYGVLQASLRTLVRLRGELCLPVLRKVMTTQSERDVLKVTALEQWMLIDLKQAYPEVIRAAKPGSSYELRIAMMSAINGVLADKNKLSQLGEDGRAAARDVFIEAAGSNNHRVRGPGISGLSHFDDIETKIFLEKIKNESHDARDRRAAEAALRADAGPASRRRNR